MSDIQVPINDLRRYAVQKQDALADIARNVIASAHYVLGPSVRAFEKAFADYCGTSHCIGVANGTDALEIALRALGVGDGDEVVVAANAAMYGTTAVLATGAEPVFCDVAPETGVMTPDSLADILRSRHPKAVIVTHLYGRLADMEQISALTRAHGVAVLEDCAQAHGACDQQGRRAGSFGDIAAFSFYPTKNLGALGDGGAITTSSDELAAKATALRQYGWSSKYCNTFAHGRNSRLDELQAALLLELLRDLDARNEARRRVAAIYTSEIRNPAIATAPSDGERYVAHLYVIRSIARESLRAHLTRSGIGSDVHYPIPDHRQPVHGTRFQNLHLPVTETLCSQVLTLPCFPEMTQDEVRRVVDACNTWNPEGGQ